MTAPRFIITGTDTGIGKTVFAAGLTAALDGCYWKPIQSGLDDETDSQTVARLTGLPANRLFPEAHRLTAPLSPHRSAEIDGIAIDIDAIRPPETGRPLIIEGAGGVLVPLTRDTLQIDLFARLNAPLIVCARTSLGTINHTLLTLEALRARALTVAGVAFIGMANADNEATICAFGNTRRLGRLPMLDPLTPGTLRAALTNGFPDVVGHLLHAPLSGPAT